MTNISKKYNIVDLGYEDGIELAKIIKNCIYGINDGKRTKLYPIIVGSLRRKKELIRDLDFLIISDKKFDDIYFKSPVIVLENYANGPSKKSYIIKIKNINIKMDLFFALPENKPFALLHHTGGKTTNIKMRVHAKYRGMKLNQYGIFKGNKRAYGSSKIKSEKNIFKFLDIEYIPVTKR
jgi:DNA polymerase (family 10)